MSYLAAWNSAERFPAPQVTQAPEDGRQLRRRQSQCATTRKQAVSNVDVAALQDTSQCTICALSPIESLPFHTPPYVETQSLLVPRFNAGSLTAEPHRNHPTDSQPRQSKGKEDRMSRDRCSNREGPAAIHSPRKGALGGKSQGPNLSSRSARWIMSDVRSICRHRNPESEN
ncbi:uncharacterized protein N7482_001258 [Penicillium canariense]|uniref:Uncharacterized protein n=1 Tax=Penicillium canariense TaxID=189055 RepID=A0A9W9IGT9_9EURO|nr:uncharacterized protein N7482_001258 [Penicillium canariense]KAJ5175381.1 hypothetical protein N7482_001258 [Penicillium canariense]